MLITASPAVVRAGFRALLSNDGIEVVGEERSGAEAVAAAAGSSPDVVVVGAALEEGCVEAVRQVRAACPGAAVVVYAQAPATMLAVIDAGASGLLLADQEPGELVAGVRAAAAGFASLPPKALAALRDAAPRTAQEAMSERELEVLGLVADGLANKEIARRLGISEGTVKSHLGSAFRRIGATRRTQAVAWVHERRARGEFPST